MAYIKTISEREAEGRLKRIYEAAIKRAGRVSGIVKIMSLDAAICDSSMKFYVTAVRSPNVLDRATREMLATVVSSVNGCFY